MKTNRLYFILFVLLLCAVILFKSGNSDKDKNRLNADEGRQIESPLKVLPKPVVKHTPVEKNPQAYDFPVTSSQTTTQGNQLSEDLIDTEKLPTLILDRPMPTNYHSETTHLFRQMLVETHPNLPLEISEKVATIVSESLESNLPSLSSNEREILNDSIRACQSIIAHLPFEKSQENLEYSIDYLVNKSKQWAADFSASLKSRYDMDPQAATSTAKKLYSSAIHDIYDDKHPETAKLISKFSAQRNNSMNCYFTPHYKYPLDEDKIVSVREELSEVINNIESEIEKRLARRKEIMNETKNPYIAKAELIKIEKQIRDRTIRQAAIFCQIIIDRAYKQAIDNAYWDNYFISEDYAAVRKQLRERRLMMWEKESNARKKIRSDLLEERRRGIYKNRRPDIPSSKSPEQIRHQMMVETQNIINRSINDLMENEI